MYFFDFPNTSMLIREYTPADLDALRRMHASQNFDYAFPDLDDPIFISKLILEDDTGRPVMAALARLTCEIYLLIDRAADSNLSSRGPSSAEGSAVAVRADSSLGAQHAAPADAAPNVSFRAECPAPLPLREAPGPGRAPGSTVSRAREISEESAVAVRSDSSPGAQHAAPADATPNACHSEQSPALFSSRGVCAARDAVEESAVAVRSDSSPVAQHAAPANATSNACHSERSPALFSSRGVCAARDVVEESLLDVTPANAPTPASCGVRELAPAVCRPGLPGSAPRIDSQSDSSQASQKTSRAPASHENSREGNARTRWTQLLALHRAGEQDLLARGLDDAHAWLPPQIAKRFGRRLESLGWLRDNTWTPYCKRLDSTG
jgi:hypothetical protein